MEFPYRERDLNVHIQRASLADSSDNNKEVSRMPPHVGVKVDM